MQQADEHHAWRVTFSGMHALLDFQVLLFSIMTSYWRSYLQGSR